MTVHGISQATQLLNTSQATARADQGERLQQARTSNQQELGELFNRFVGETFYGQLLKSMRSTLGKPAYFHGGRAEEVFQGQLDQIFAERMAEKTADSFAEPLLDLFSLPRPS